MFSDRVRVRLVAIALLVGVSVRAEMPSVAGTMPEDSLPGLRKLLETADRQAPQLLLKQLELEQAAAGVTSARSRQLPVLGMDMNYATSQSSISGNSTSESRSNGFFYSFNFGQPLFYWGEIQRGLDIAKLRELMTQRGFQETRRQLFGTLRQQYLVLVARKAALMHARSTLDQIRRDIESTRVRVELGAATEIEVGGREAALAERQLEFDRTEEDYNRSRRSLGRLAGLPEFADEDVAVEIPKPAVPLETAGRLVSETLRSEGRNTFTAEIAQMRVREADLNYRNTRVRLLPKFNLGASQSLRNSTNVDGSSVSQTGISQLSAEVNARWTLWDSFATRAARLDALAGRRMAQQQFQSTVDATVEEVLRQQKEFEFAARGLDFTDSRRSTTEQALANTRREAEFGNVAPSAITGAERELLAAQATTASARATYYIAWGNLVSLAGADPFLNAGSSKTHGR